MTHSQIGQDLEVVRVYNRKRDGYFIEVGASDGVQLSNTLLLEKEYGWRGICCEPIPLTYEALVKNRPNCFCVKDALYSESGQTVEFKVAGMLSGISSHIDAHRRLVDKTKTVIEVRTTTLMDVLRDAEAPRFIEYMSLDTEGSEYKILENFDFTKYTFGLIDVEHNYIEPRRTDIRTLLLKNGYLYKGANKFDDMYMHASLK
jgi:FkbM family methyltransferase